MSNIEDQKKHYDELLTLVEAILEEYSKYKEHPEAHVEYGVIEEEGLAKDTAHTAHNQLCFDISNLNFKANN